MRTTLIKALRRLPVLAGLSLLTVCHAGAQHVVLEDTFERTTSGDRNGTLAFAPSLPPFGYALQGTTYQASVRYTFSGWNTQTGTLEAWVFLPSFSSSVTWYNFLTLQWFNSWTDEGSGYIGELGIIGPDGKGNQGHLYWNNWNASSSSNLVSVGKMPLNEWCHVAVSWSSYGTSLYLNDAAVAHSSTDMYPSLNPTTYLFVATPTTSTPGNPNVHFWIDNVILCDYAKYATAS